MIPVLTALVLPVLQFPVVVRTDGVSSMTRYRLDIVAKLKSLISNKCLKWLYFYLT